jgi:hypothetical protein
MKSPPKQVRDDIAKDQLEAWIDGRDLGEYVADEAAAATE